MSFRKRNMVISQPDTTGSAVAPEKALPTGVRSSPVDGRLTTSTGTRSLDALLAGNSGLVLGTSLLVEENGTTDFAGALLRFYAAEGTVQGHQLHVFGVPNSWARELPGLSDDTSDEAGEKNIAGEKMKIAWRYEKLEGLGSGGMKRKGTNTSSGSSSSAELPFCHEFDLRKRLVLPSSLDMHFIQIPAQANFSPLSGQSSPSPYDTFISHLTSLILTTPESKIHRIIIPTLLSPALYPSYASEPKYILQFLHALRGLLRKHSQRLSALITLPLALHPRSTGLTRWIELLSDGVLELIPFPSSHLPTKVVAEDSSGKEEAPQGLLKIHRLPIFHEKGGGVGAANHRDDMAFTLSRRHGVVMKQFSLPPLAEYAGGAEYTSGSAKKADLEF